MVTAKEFISEVYIPLNEGWGYIYGTWGIVWTQARQDAATREMTKRYGSKWIGKMVTDCSGLLRWALKQLGEDIVHHARYQYTDYCRNKGRLVNGLREDGSSVLPGTAVFLQGSEEHIHHVGVYVGNGICIEAKGTQYGVVTSQLTHWDHWGELNMVDYSDAAELEGGDIPERPDDIIFRATVNNPNTWLNVRSGPGMQYPLRFQVHKGATVDVVAQNDAGDWWQIKYGGQIGWAFAEYLEPVDDPADIPVEEPEEPDEPDIENVPVIESKPSVVDELQEVLMSLMACENKIAAILRRM